MVEDALGGTSRSLDGGGGKRVVLEEGHVASRDLDGSRTGAHFGEMRLLLAVASLLTLACSDRVTGPGPQSLSGHWVSQRFHLGPSASYEQHLTFGPFMRFASEARNYGSYPGQGPDEFSGYSRVEGTYGIDGDRLHFHPQRVVEWDLFYGPNSPVEIIQPYPYGTVFDSARFDIAVDRLTLRYLSYPLDAPVATTLELTRVLDSTQ